MGQLGDIIEAALFSWEDDDTQQWSPSSPLPPRAKHSQVIFLALLGSRHCPQNVGTAADNPPLALGSPTGAGLGAALVPGLWLTVVVVGHCGVVGIARVEVGHEGRNILRGCEHPVDHITHEEEAWGHRWRDPASPVRPPHNCPPARDSGSGVLRAREPQSRAGPACAPWA